MLGQWGSVSLTSPSGACLELAQPCCAQCVRFVCVKSFRLLLCLKDPQTSQLPLPSSIFLCPLLKSMITNGALFSWMYSLYSQQKALLLLFPTAILYRLPFSPWHSNTHIVCVCVCAYCPIPPNSVMQITGFVLCCQCMSKTVVAGVCSVCVHLCLCLCAKSARVEACAGWGGIWMQGWLGTAMHTRCEMDCLIKC